MGPLRVVYFTLASTLPAEHNCSSVETTSQGHLATFCKVRTPSVLTSKTEAVPWVQLEGLSSALAFGSTRIFKED